MAVVELDDARLTNAAPVRSLEQRMDALTKANHVRSYRAYMKRGIRIGVVSPAEPWSQRPAEIESMKVLELLMALPKYGRVKVNRTLGRCAISPSKTIGGLSPRQRKELEMCVPALRQARTTGGSE